MIGSNYNSVQNIPTIVETCTTDGIIIGFIICMCIKLSSNRKVSNTFIGRNKNYDVKNNFNEIINQK